jgi:hypothetical protein
LEIGRAWTRGVPHLRDGFIVDGTYKVGHFRGSENPVTFSSPLPVRRKTKPSIELVRPKIKLEKVENFQRSNKRHLRTTIHHTITTISPANYHQKTHDFSRTPFKNARITAKKNAPQSPDFFCQIRVQKTISPPE